jgi:hypothetical protein
MEKENIIVGVIIFVVLILVGLISFKFGGEIAAKNNLSVGGGFKVVLGPRGEKYIVFKKDAAEGLKSKPFTTNVHDIPSVWDSDAGQRSTPATGRNATIMSYDEGIKYPTLVPATKLF